MRDLQAFSVRVLLIGAAKVCVRSSRIGPTDREDRRHQALDRAPERRREHRMDGAPTRPLSGARRCCSLFTGRKSTALLCISVHLSISIISISLSLLSDRSCVRALQVWRRRTCGTARLRTTRSPARRTCLRPLQSSGVGGLARRRLRARADVRRHRLRRRAVLAGGQLRGPVAE